MGVRRPRACAGLDALRQAIDQSVQQNLDQHLDGRGQQQPSVLDIEVVHRRRFYGLHEVDEPFAKVYLLHPHRKRSIADLLRRGAVGGQQREVFESHVPYIQQFFIDHDLRGMGYLLAASFTCRCNLVNEYVACAEHWLDDRAREAHLPQGRTSRCDFEASVLAADVVKNAHGVGFQSQSQSQSASGAANEPPKSKREIEITNPGLAALWQEEREFRRSTEGRCGQLGAGADDDRADIIRYDRYDERVARMIEHDRACAAAAARDSTGGLREAQRHAAQSQSHLSQSQVFGHHFAQSPPSPWPSPWPSPVDAGAGRLGRSARSEEPWASQGTAATQGTQQGTQGTPGSTTQGTQSSGEAREDCIDLLRGMYEGDLARDAAVDDLYSLYQDDQERAEAAAREARDEDDEFEAMSQVSTTYVPRAVPEGSQESPPKRCHIDPSSEAEFPPTIQPGQPDPRAHSGRPGKGGAYGFVGERPPPRRYSAIGESQPPRSAGGPTLLAFPRLAEEGGAAAASDGGGSGGSSGDSGSEDEHLAGTRSPLQPRSGSAPCSPRSPPSPAFDDSLPSQSQGSVAGDSPPGQGHDRGWGAHTATPRLRSPASPGAWGAWGGAEAPPTIQPGQRPRHAQPTTAVAVAATPASTAATRCEAPADDADGCPADDSPFRPGATGQPLWTPASPVRLNPACTGAPTGPDRAAVASPPRATPVLLVAPDSVSKSAGSITQVTPNAVRVEAIPSSNPSECGASSGMTPQRDTLSFAFSASGGGGTGAAAAASGGSVARAPSLFAYGHPTDEFPYIFRPPSPAARRAKAAPNVVPVSPPESPTMPRRRWRLFASPPPCTSNLLQSLATRSYPAQPCAVVCTCRPRWACTSTDTLRVTEEVHTPPFNYDAKHRKPAPKAFDPLYNQATPRFEQDEGADHPTSSSVADVHRWRSAQGALRAARDSAMTRPGAAAATAAATAATTIDSAARWWQPARPPPRASALRLDDTPLPTAGRRRIRWKNNGAQRPKLARQTSRVRGVTQARSYCFANDSQSQRSAEGPEPTVLAVEVFCATHDKNLRPDPAVDAVLCVFYHLSGTGLPDPRGGGSARANAEAPGDPGDADQNPKHSTLTGVLYWDKDEATNMHNFISAPGLNEAKRVSNEFMLFEELLERVREWDPDILCGYEVQMQSWNYLIERYWVKCKKNLSVQLSRVQCSEGEDSVDPKAWSSSYDAANTSEIVVGGRVVLNLWRVMRGELTLTSYSFENVCFHLLHQRVPAYTPWQLHHWWVGGDSAWVDPGGGGGGRLAKLSTMRAAARRNGGPHTHESCRWGTRWRVIKHYVHRVTSCVNMLNELDFVQRNCEFARLFGILFEEVLSRGSQFRVESIMIRLAHAENYVLTSPGKDDIRGMGAPTHVAKILEPNSKLYEDPVVVLDFASLYPSIMIGWNMCYSTCLGNIPSVGSEHKYNEPGKLGTNTYCPPPGVLSELGVSGVNVAPSGTLFCGKAKRRGILPQMLADILNTRVMVKASKKILERKNRDGNSTRIRLLESRQLGLKLIANVTYGYTSANLSGRMPCVHIADSIVSMGKHTLERAMDGAEELLQRYNARVVYGDTDSLFLHLPGVSIKSANRIGLECADKLSEHDPHPMKLKFEKVYCPCVLQTKKRYVGYMYETHDQETPTFEAKGIETVRRDGCGIVRKMLEKSIRILFETKDLERVAEYVTQQWTAMLAEGSNFAGPLNIVDYIIAKEYRGKRSTSQEPGAYKPLAKVAALKIAETRGRLDPRSVPRIKERVPYVIVEWSGGGRGNRIYDCVADPHMVIRNGYRLDIKYYIEKQVAPALKRVFDIIKPNLVDKWWREMPRPNPARYAIRGQKRGGVNTMSQHLRLVNCILCNKVVETGRPCGKPGSAGRLVCNTCRASRGATTAEVAKRVHTLERRGAMLADLCRSCMGFRGEAEVEPRAAEGGHAGLRPHARNRQGGLPARNGHLLCESDSCPVYYEHNAAVIRLADAQQIRDVWFDWLPKDDRADW